MSVSPQVRIESIIRSLKENGVQAAPIAEALDLATTHPNAVIDLAIAVLREYPKGGTFLDDALSYLPQEKWPDIVSTALDTLEQSGKNDAASSIIEYASLQSPTALHSQLDRIFLLQPNESCYFECDPWRESGGRHFDFLRNVIEQSTSSDDERSRAWSALFETRHTMLIDYAIRVAADITRANWSLEDWVQCHLHRVGFQMVNESFQRITPDLCYHLQFPDEIFESQIRPFWLERVHQTWKLTDSIQPIPFGGLSEGLCSLCGKMLHRLLILDPIPPGLGITQMKRLEIATCLSCLGWERMPLFYQHQEDGPPRNIGYDGSTVKPKIPAGPLRESTIGLAPTPRRWYWQSWGSSNGRQNMNRIGGEPCWVQDAHYPNCPTCLKLMPFLFQLDSNLPRADDGEWLWGSGGCGYGFWCDKCKVSGIHWQCT